MFTFIQMEFLKLKRSKIFLLTLLGAIFPPFLLFLASLSFGETVNFSSMFNDTNLYMATLFAVLLFSIIISYLFGREYNEHTLKTILTIPISRGKFLLSKYLMFLVWIIIMTVVTTLSCVVLGFIGGFEGFSLKLLFDSFVELLYSNILLFLTFSPFVFISLIVTNMVPAMIGGAGLTLANLMVYNQEWAPFVPWICPYLVSSGEIASYGVNSIISYGIILATFVVGLAISYIYFIKKDVSL